MHSRTRDAGLALAAVLILTPPAAAHPGASIAVSRNGDVYFIDTGHGLWKIDGSGQLVDLGRPAFHWFVLDETSRFSAFRVRTDEYEIVPVKDGQRTLVVSSDFALAIANGGLYYAPNSKGATSLLRAEPGGRRTTVARLNGVDGTLRWVNGIAADARGTIYLSEDTAIQAIGARGRAVVFAKDLRVPQCAELLQDEERSPYLRGLAVTDEGSVYVAATGCRTVVKLGRDGGVTPVLRAEAPWSPTSVAWHDGELYVLEYDHSLPERQWTPRVRKLARDGQVVTLATVRR
jgi:hypothetical protein